MPARKVIVSCAVTGSIHVPDMFGSMPVGVPYFGFERGRDPGENKPPVSLNAPNEKRRHIN